MVIILYRIFFFLLGALMFCYGIASTIIFLPLLSWGYSFVELLELLFSNLGVYLLMIGLGLMIYTLFIKKEE